VLVQRPTTLEALAEDAAIGEANARANPTVVKTTDAAVTAQLAEMRAMMTTLQDVVIAGQRQHNTPVIYFVDAPTAIPEHPAATTTTTLWPATTRVQTNAATTTATLTTTPSDPRNVTMQFVVPVYQTPLPRNTAVDTAETAAARGRGRGWRGPWRGLPNSTNRSNPSARRDGSRIPTT